MKSTWKRLLSLLLVAAMVLSFGATGYAADTDDIDLVDPEEEAVASQQTEAVADGTQLQQEPLDPSTLGVHKLGEETKSDEITVFDTDEPIEAEEIDLNEIVRVSIFLYEAPAMDLGTSMRGLGTNSSVAAYRSSLRASQDSLAAEIESATGHPLDVRWNMTLAVNAMSAYVRLGDIETIAELPGVRAVVRENYYLPPVEEPSDPNTASTSENMVGATAAWADGYTGAGSRIAIIDTGIDTTHQSFAEEPFTYSVNQAGASAELMTKAQVQALASQLNSKTGNYVSAKIPYGYNYVDKSTTITHVGDTQGEHGSHVAGIAAANRYIGSAHSDAASTVGAVGMAPDAQLFIMKVFGAGGGAYDSDYMVAIEDAIILDCDVVNLSLGSAVQGWTFSDEYQDILNNLVNREHNEGMVVSISAGNSYDFAKLTTAGNLYKDDVYYHTGGSPGSYVNSLCVAAAQNTLTTGTPMVFNGSQNVFYSESTGNEEEGTTYTNPELTTIAGTYNYVYIDAVGEAADFGTVNNALSLSGKVVIVNRGGISFSDKGNNAKSYSPKAVIIANNSDGTILMNLADFTGTFPMVSITLKDANLIKEGATAHTAGGITYYTGSMQVTKTEMSVLIDRSQATITDFSSWGVPGSLIMKPEITAPGGDIYSVFGTNKTSGGATAGGPDQYEYMSGTSMAAPHITGLSAVVAEYLREHPVADRNSALNEAFSTRAIIQSLLMSTATPMKPDGEYLPVLQQGAGLADVSKAVSAPSVLMMTDEGNTLTARTGSIADGKVKAEFGDDPAREGVYSYGFTLYNLSDKNLSYTLSTDLFTQKISGSFLTRGTSNLPGGGVSYTWNGVAPAPTSEHDVNRDGVTDENDAQAILDFLAYLVEEEDLDLSVADLDGDDAITSYDAYLLLNYEPEGGTPTGDYVLAAHDTATVTVTIKLTAAQRSFLEENYPHGAYLEGFTYVSCSDSTREGEDLSHVHTIPLLGFYGSWTDPSMFDNMSYIDGLYGAERIPYSGNSDTNYLMLNYNGSNVKFSGNPYMVEEEFPADRLALSSNTNLIRISYNLIRSAATTGYAVTRLDDEGIVTDILSSSVTGNSVTGQWYSSSSGAWQNTGTKLYSINKTVSSYGLEEGDHFRLGFYAIPEYNGMLVNDSYDAAGSGMLNLKGFNTLLTENTLGKGAMVGYDFVVDDTDPVIGSATLSGNTITVQASDNENLAYVAVLSLDGTIKYAEAAPGDKTYSISFDASDAIANANGFVAVFAGDYAGNEAARAIKVNDNTMVEKTVFVLTNSLTAGNDYLIVSRNTAGSGTALGHSGTTVATNAVTVKAGISDTGNQPYIESTDAASTSVWTASSGIKLMNGSYYLRRSSNTGTTLQASTTNNYNTWTWDSSNNRLSMTISNRSYYLRFYSNTFSLNTATNSVYVYQKTVIRTEVDPYTATGINLTPSSLDLYKGNTADLTAKVTPITAEDRTVTWSSSDSSVASVDQNGHVTAVAAGTATIKATANGNSAVTAECAVTVTAVNKTLNAFIWDKEGNVYISSFNANNLPTWTKLSNNALGVYLHNAYMASASALYASTCDVNGDNLLYTVNRTSYALTEAGACYVPTFGMAKGHTGFSSQGYNFFAYGFAKYIILGRLEQEEDGTYDDNNNFVGNGSYYVGMPYGLLDLTTTDVGDSYVAAVCAKQVGSSSSTYYFLDESGKIWQITNTYGSSTGFKFGTPTLVVDTGIGTSFMYQSLYYDGTYIYWSHQTDSESELIIYNVSAKKLYHAGNFGDGVWPAAGLFVNGSVAPASVDEDVPMAFDLKPVATRDELLTEEIRQRLGIAMSGEETSDDDLELVDEEPVIEPDLEVEEPEIIEIEPDGTLTAFRGLKASDEPTDIEPDEEGLIRVEIKEEEASTNGLIAITYDPSILVLDKEKTHSDLAFNAYFIDDDPEKGVITFAYANKTALPADTVLIELVFRAGCEDSEIIADRLEHNQDFDLADTIADYAYTGSHNWGEPVWTWAEDYGSATASFVCQNNSEHAAECEATVTEETAAPGCETEGTTTYTATVELDGKEYQDQKTVTTPASGHVWGNPVWTWADDLESASVTFTCANDASHTVTFDAEIKSVVDPEPDCTNPGTKTISAVYTLDGKVYDDQKEISVPALGHDWGEVTYTWSDDNSSVTATRVCKNDEIHVETETVNTTAEVTKPATCETKGETTYTAVFKNAAFETQTRTVEDVEALGHTPGEAVRENEKAATCEAEGSYDEVVYCTVCGKELSRETKTVPALGHDWGEVTYTWSDDNSSVTGIAVCKRNAAHELTETVTATYEVITAPTTTSEGLGRWTASFSKDPFTTQTKDVTIEKLPETGFAIHVIDYTKSAASCSIDSEAFYQGEVVFTVEADTAVLVAVKNGEEDYTVLTCSTDEEGNHSFTLQVTKETTIVLAFKGDADLDGVVRSTDGTMIKRAAMNTFTLEGKLNELVSDINGDGELKATEGTMVSRAALNTYEIPW